MTLKMQLEVSQMKPFLAPKISTCGRQLLELQIENGDLDSVWNLIGDRQIIAYGTPEGRTFKAVWEFNIYIGNSVSFLEFSSACTQVIGWQEVGSLNIRVGVTGGQTSAPDLNIYDTIVPSFFVTSIEKLIYEDSDVISECGLVFHGADGAEIIVAAGIPPGSVSVAAPFASGQFEPQFDIAACRRVLIGSRRMG